MILLGYSVFDVYLHTPTFPHHHSCHPTLHLCLITKFALHPTFSTWKWHLLPWSVPLLCLMHTFCRCHQTQHTVCGISCGTQDICDTNNARSVDTHISPPCNMGLCSFLLPLFSFHFCHFLISLIHHLFLFHYRLHILFLFHCY